MRRLFGNFLDVNNRVYTHLLFWAVYYFHRVYLYIEHYDQTPIVQLIELPVKVGVAYLHLYLLMPVWLANKKYFYYGIGIVSSIFLGTVLQTEIIRGMIGSGIYRFNADLLYSPWKFSSTASHITMIVFITMLIKILKDQYLQQQKVHKVEKQRLHSELMFLKTQINPHFFFNTLNNLYSLVLNKSDKAADAILKLSALMEYVIYESEKKKVSLSSEIAHLHNFIDLEKLRFGSELTIQLDLKLSEKDFRIPPMLLIPLVENCFKHGKANKNNEFLIRISAEIKRKMLIFNTYNTHNAEAKTDKKVSTHYGVGLQNVMRRIELIYGKNASFQTHQQLDSFSLTVQLPLEHENKEVHEA